MSATTAPKFRVIAASVQGTSHVRTAVPCQDAYHFAELPNGDLVVAVADGAGSAPCGQEGAQLAVRAATAGVKEALAKYRPTSSRAWAVVVRGAFRRAQRAIAVEAEHHKAAVRDFAATLLLMILRDDATICGLVGDCGAVLRHNDGQFLSPCVPQRGEYANTTNFIVQPDAEQLLDIQQITEPITAAALFSDGLVPLAMNIAQNRPHAPFFEPLFGFLAAAEDATLAGEQLADFLSSERVNARTDDDKTLILIQRN